MPAAKDISNNIAVVGLGFAGLSAAFLLAKNGFNVTVIGQSRFEIASFAAQGLSTLKGIFHADEKLFKLKIDGHHFFIKWLEEIEKISGLKIQKTFSVKEGFESLKDFQKEQGRIFRKEFSGLKQVIFEPYPKNKNLFFENRYPNDFWIKTESYLEALYKACIILGCTFVENVSLQSLEHDQGHINIRLSSRDEINVAKCVLAVGPSSRAYLEKYFTVQESLISVPGFSFCGEAKNAVGNENRVKNLSSAAVYDEVFYCGSTSEETDKGFSDDHIKTQFEKIKSVTLDWFESLAASKINLTSTRFGVRVRTKKRQPILLESKKVPGLVLMTGFYKSGMTLTPLFANQVVQLFKGK